MSDGRPEAALDRHTLELPADRLEGRSFLLGNRAGFVLYLPAANNVHDATLQGSKWFGASGFGKSFLEGFVLWVEVEGARIPLDRRNQTGFVMRLDNATRVYTLPDGREVRERYFVPNGVQAVVLSLEGDCEFGIRPEFDMRYYQAFNTDFSSYGCEMSGDRALVRNRVTGAGPLHEDLEFYGSVGALVDGSIESVPPDERLVEKIYLKDERREKAIESVYSETGAQSPDEAPIWNQYSTQVYSPVRLRIHGPGTVVCVCGDTPAEVDAGFDRVQRELPSLRADKAAVIAGELADGKLETGVRDVDDAYAHVLTRFNDCLVARDANLHVPGTEGTHANAILAGNKYFMDPWKRDENISLRALLATNDYETVRAILDSTWQFQDERTGRLPHIIRTGEPLVYYSSDGTLWALHRLYQYTRCSGDRTLLQAKLAMVQHFFRASEAFVQRGLLPSGGIIDPKYRWETWEDTPFTPRDGYPVEIELLWLTVLAEFVDLVEDEAVADWMRSTHTAGMETFQHFYGGDYLFDSLGYDWNPRRLLTPNGYLAFDLAFPLPPALQRAMVPAARDQLAGRRGVRSLAPRDWPEVFPPAFLADPRSHTGKNMASFGIFNYHRGIEWEWLNPGFVAAELQAGNAHHALALYTAGQVTEALRDAGVGGLSELYDEHGQLGADYQAWSLAALIDSLHLYAGISVDAIEGKIRIAPSLPPSWPYLQTRSRIGSLPFDCRYERVSEGEERFQFHPDHAGAEGITVTFVVPLPQGRRIEHAACNREALPKERWSYEAAGEARLACVSFLAGADLDLRVCTFAGGRRGQ